MNKTVQTDQNRRNFLRGSVMAGAGTTLAVALPGLAQAQTEPEAPVAIPEPTQHKGYQLTEHVSAYYRSASI